MPRHFDPHSLLSGHIWWGFPIINAIKFWIFLWLCNTHTQCVCIALNPNILTYHICDILTFTFFPSLRRDQRNKWIGRLCNLLNIEFAFLFLSEMCFYLPVSARGTGPEWKHPSLVTYLRDIMHSSTINTNFWVSTFQVATPIGYPAADT